MAVENGEALFDLGSELGDEIRTQRGGLRQDREHPTLGALLLVFERRAFECCVCNGRALLKWEEGSELELAWPIVDVGHPPTAALELTYLRPMLRQRETEIVEVLTAFENAPLEEAHSLFQG